jgi:CheY-like chemotaxis protein
MATVLIVEDEFAIADLLEIVLTDEGYTVLMAANGREALNLLKEGPNPDLVISDFMMPVLDGAAMVRMMRESEAQRSIPLILMSSMPEANVRERIGGHFPFIRKPFQLDAVIQAVAEVLNAVSYGLTGKPAP